MALTTTGAVKCFNMDVEKPKYATRSPAITRVYRVNASQTIKKGEPVIQSAGKASLAADTADLAGTALLGIAAHDKTTTGTVTENDTLIVYDAKANLFSASFVTSETVDADVATRANMLAARPLLFANVAPYSGTPFATFWGISVTAAVNNICTVLDISSGQPFVDPATGVQLVRVGDKVPASGAQVGILNPRVIFVFNTALTGL